MAVAAQWQWCRLRCKRWLTDALWPLRFQVSLNPLCEWEALWECHIKKWTCNIADATFLFYNTTPKIGIPLWGKHSHSPLGLRTFLNNISVCQCFHSLGASGVARFKLIKLLLQYSMKSHVFKKHSHSALGLRFWTTSSWVKRLEHSQGVAWWKLGWQDSNLSNCYFSMFLFSMKSDIKALSQCT